MNHKTVLDNIGTQMVFFDGGMGSLLQSRGLKGGELPETWNIEKPEEILSIHKAYLEAGCDILKSNTFGANGLKFDGAPYTVADIVTAGVAIAKQAIQEVGHGMVALDLGPTGKLLKPLGDLSFEDAYALFAEMVDAGVAAGAEAILIETMSDTYETKAAVLAAKEHANLPIFVTMIFDEHGKLLTGGDIPSAVAMLEGLGVTAIGFNCGLGPVQMLELLKTLREYTSLPIVVNPNAGLPTVVDGKTVYTVEPEAFATAMTEIVQNGATILGGCCGTTPAHLKAVVDACKDLSPLPITDKQRTVISSYGHAVVFGKQPVLIGERINPTGKKRFQQALRENDLEYILKEAVTQEENGAHVLDVNVGLPEIDEVAMMEQTVLALQSITDLPLQIDTTNLDAMERALRLYNGKALINSVNGKKENMEAIFPLVKKYGGAVICLTIDENGIPKTAEGRYQIAKKIMETAATYGIPKKDLIVDVLAMTISAEQEAAQVTLDALKLVKEKLGLHTSLGVSNISFGLPQRALVNATFFTMALQNGLSGAILNPNDAGMMASHYSYCALTSVDENCMAYIAKYANKPAVATTPTVTADISLKESILKGLKESAGHAAKELLQTKQPLEIIETELIPALDVVGKDFEAGTLFLPQLLMSAEAAKVAFEAIKTHLSQTGAKEQKREKIILATVKGDIHDIGKNIVKVLLENYSYDVIDLGKDVPPEVILQAVEEHQIQLVGLSALMTTTVVHMEETIALLHQKAPWCKVMVGGAVLTQSYADQISADFYSKDAMGSVHFAHRLFGYDH